MIGVMLTVFNQLEDTLRTLESFEKTTNLPYRLVIVDNASTDETVPYLSSKGYQMIEFKQMTSGTVRINQGIKYLLSDPAIRYIVWIHNDMLFFSGWLERLAEHLLHNNSIGKLAPDSVNNYGQGPDAAEFAEA